MLPILNRPVIDDLVSELSLTGVTEIAFVILPGDDQLHHYFIEFQRARDVFASRGWLNKYAPITELHQRLDGVDFHWIEQPMDGRCGTAVPVLRSDGGSDLDDLIKACAYAGTPAAIQVTSVPVDRMSRYGVVKTRACYLLFAGAVEKPRRRSWRTMERDFVSTIFAIRRLRNCRRAERTMRR